MGPGLRGQSPPDLPLRSTLPTLPFLCSEWNVSAELFDAFLAWLAPDREEAGRKYEDIRRRLTKIFAGRGCFCPEDLADETNNRVIVKVPEISEGYHGDPGRYFGGVARNVYHEYARKRVVPPPPAETGILSKPGNRSSIASRNASERSPRPIGHSF